MPVVVALPELLILAGLLFSIGILMMGDAFTRALFQVTEAGIGWIPWVGKKAANGVHAVSQRISHYFGSAVARLEGGVSDSWHVLAYLIEQTGQAIFDATRAAAHALWLVEVKYPLRALHYLAHKGVQAAGVTTKVTTTIVRRTVIISGVTTKQLARFGKRVHALEARVAHLSHIAAIPAAEIHAIPAKIGVTWKQLRGIRLRLTRLEKATVGVGAVALVGTALGRMRLGWLRCPALSRVGRKIGCGGFGILEEFLAPAFEALVVLDLCRFALGAQKLVRAFAPELGLVILAADAICLGGGASLPTAADAPTLSATIRLPTAHD